MGAKKQRWISASGYADTHSVPARILQPLSSHRQKKLTKRCVEDEEEVGDEDGLRLQPEWETSQRLRMDCAQLIHRANLPERFLGPLVSLAAGVATQSLSPGVVKAKRRTRKTLWHPKGKPSW